MQFTDLYILIDSWLIAPYRWPSSPDAGFLCGSFFLAFQSFILSRIFLFLIRKVQKKTNKKIEEELDKREKLSFSAISDKNKEAYIIQNDMAQKAYGRFAGLMLGRICIAVFPVFMALGWLQTRFYDTALSFSILGRDILLTYFPVFIFFYISLNLFFFYFLKSSFFYLIIKNLKISAVKAR